MQQILDWVAAHGIWAPVLFVFFYAGAAVAFVPGSLLTLSAGAVFGVVKGVALVSLGSTLAAATSHDQRVNPIIVIPGIMGSKLIDESSGKMVWGSYGSGAIRHSSPDGMRTMSIPMSPGTPLVGLTDSVDQDGTLDRLIPGPGFSVKAYARLLQALAIGGYRDQQILEKNGEEHFTCFQFAYDWRRSNADNAALLADYIEDRKAYVEAENFRRFGTRREVKFDIVAHSMGGILARYYLMYGSAPVPEAVPA